MPCAWPLTRQRFDTIDRFPLQPVHFLDQDASKRFERTRELLAASEAEKAQVVQAFQERLHASKLDIER